ncbi:MAG: V-type ATPase subunit [Candidatus Caldatribacteriaceae bacterium]
MKLQTTRPVLREDIGFAYLVGRVRALESGILSQRVLENILKAEDLDQALRVVAEIPYWGTVFQGSFHSLQAIDEALTSHYWGFVEDFSRYKIAQVLTRFFILGFDFNFLKLAIKSHLAKKPLEKSYPTTLDAKRVFRFFSGEGGEFLPEPFERAVREAFAALESHSSHIQLLEFVLDRFYLQEVYQLALASESQVLKNWFLAYVAFAHMRGVLRARCQGGKPEMVRLLYAPNPLVPQDAFMGLLNATSEKVSEMIADLGFQFILPAEPFRDDPYYVAEVEKNVDNYLIRFARSFRSQTFGPEPVFGFLFAKGMDVKNLRIVLEGKYFGLPQEVLQNKVRECYYE